MNAGDSVSVRGWRGVAFTVWETVGDIARVIMVGDDAIHEVELRDCTILAEDSFCGSCGQIGCCHGS